MLQKSLFDSLFRFFGFTKLIITDRYITLQSESFVVHLLSSCDISQQLNAGSTISSTMNNRYILKL